MPKQEVLDKAEPGSDEWLQTISGSKIAAIMGLSRWETAYSLWHRMKGNRPPQPPKDIFIVGHAMEPACAEWYRLDRQAKKLPTWTMSRGEVQYTDTDLPFPNIATADRRASRGRGRRVIEFKTARYLEEWGDLDGTRMPKDYWAQVIWNMGISGQTNFPAHLVLLGPFLKFYLYEIPFNQEYFNRMVDEAAKFYTSLELGIEPEFQGLPPDYTVVKERHPDINGESVEVTPDVADNYAMLTAQLEQVKEKQEIAKAKLAHEMGSNEFALVNGTPLFKRQKSGRGVTIKEVKSDA